MKVNEVILTEQDLYELNLRQAIAAGALGLGLMSSPSNLEPSAAPQPSAQEIEQYQARRAEIEAERRVEREKKEREAARQRELAEKIAKRYRVDTEFAQQVVQLAHKYQKPTFPKAEDILALVGIESSFNPTAVSGLKTDPAVGLTQVRPQMWNLDREELANDIEQQIAVGANILHQYYKRLKSPKAAIAAYNVGPTGYRKGHPRAQAYLAKFANEIKHYTGFGS